MSMWLARHIEFSSGIMFVLSFVKRLQGACFKASDKNFSDELHCEAKNCTILFLQLLFQIFLYLNSYWYTYTLINFEQNDIKIINLL